MASEREVRNLLEDRPDLEPAIEAILEPEPPWEFHDVPLDSGASGGLVNAGIVEKTEGGYRVAIAGAPAGTGTGGRSSESP